MAVSEINVSGSFLFEVNWARESIARINEARIRDLPLGLVAATRQPDALFVGFARRDLLFYPYLRAHGLAIGTVEAFSANVTTLHSYIERERREEVQSVNAKIAELSAEREQGQNIGLLAPDGSFDDLARYFALRELVITPFYRGKFSVGELSAFDENIARLRGYLAVVAGASAR